jgi:hypothetical protein
MLLLKRGAQALMLHIRMAARFNHLKQADLPQRAGGATNGALNRIYDAFLRRAGNLDDSVNVIGHR